MTDAAATPRPQPASEVGRGRVARKAATTLASYAEAVTDWRSREQGERLADVAVDMAGLAYLEYSDDAARRLLLAAAARLYELADPAPEAP